MDTTVDGLAAELGRLGLSELEARAYLALLADGPTTGYQLAQRLGKQSANVYRVVETLAEKGAVAVQAGRTRLLTAIGPEEFLAQVQRRQQSSIAKLSAGLKQLRRRPDSGQLYVLDNLDAVLERARTMLASATHIAVLDAFPRALGALAEPLAEAVARGVQLYVQAYAPTTLAGAHLVVSHQAAAVLAHWRSEQLNLVVDGRETLLALCRPQLDGVIEAYWSNSVYLSCIQHAGLLREHAFNQLHALLAAGKATPRRLATLVRESPTFHALQLPAQQALIERLGGPRPVP